MEENYLNFVIEAYNQENQIIEERTNEKDKETEGRFLNTPPENNSIGP